LLSLRAELRYHFEQCRFRENVLGLIREFQKFFAAMPVFFRRHLHAPHLVKRNRRPIVPIIVEDAAARFPRKNPKKSRQ
jgi:hypothetical protein